MLTILNNDLNLKIIFIDIYTKSPRFDGTHLIFVDFWFNVTDTDTSTLFGFVATG